MAIRNHAPVPHLPSGPSPVLGRHALALFDDVPSGICMLDPEGRILGANAWFCGCTGYTQDELLNLRVADITHPGDRVRDEIALRQLTPGDARPCSIDKRFVRKDGSILWMNSKLAAVTDEDGRLLHVIASMHEIEAQKRAEAALLAETTRRQQIVEAIDEGFLVLDAGFRVLQINAEALRIVGRAKEDVIGRACSELWPGIEASPVSGACRQALREGVPRTLQQCWIVNSRERWADVRIFPSGDGLTVFWRDITERRQTEKALRVSEARFRTIANAMPQMVWSTRADGYHDYFNRQWHDYTGMPEGATDGDAWNDMFHPDDRQRAWDRWRHSLATGEPYEIQYRLRHHSGDFRWTLGRALPLHDETGKIVRWMGTCTDIHDQKLAEEELKAGNRRKDEFLAMLAHELRNPLAPISTAAQLLKICAGDERRVRQASEIIGRQVRHMTELVDDLLDVSRVTRGLVTLDLAEIDLKQVLAGAVEQSRPLIEGRHHVLKTRMDGQPAMVRGDGTRMIQVVANLLNNAAKYTPQGGEITLSLEVLPDQARISVQDNGIGIDQSLLPRIFELFTQAERTPDRAQGGLGLGLALVKSIMMLHGGGVEAHSEGPGRGSRFAVTMPLLVHGRTGSAPPEHRPAPAQPLHLMVVDDNQDAALTLAALLEAHGHRVSISYDGAGALAQAAHDPPQVFILDFGLPDIDGIALARRLRAMPETGSALLIALTGYGQERDRAAAREAGFNHHLVKPLDSERLFSLLAGRR